MAAAAARKAIYEAASNGDAGVVARMLDEDPQLLSVTYLGITLLSRATWNRHVGVVKVLLERGADVHAQDDDGDTALHCAAMAGHEEVVSLLLANGADIRSRGNGGRTALVYASRSHKLAVVRLLLRYLGGCGLDDRDEDGCTALWYACIFEGGHAALVRVLLLSGADHSFLEDDGLTPQEVAQDNDHDQCVAVIQWWEGELERGYMVHRARCLLEQQRQMPPVLTAYMTTTSTAFLAALATVGPLSPFMEMRLRPRTLPTLELACLTEPSEAEMGKGKRKEQGDGESLSEEEKDATLKYVMHDLARELYTELVEGFHK